MDLCPLGIDMSKNSQISNGPIVVQYDILGCVVILWESLYKLSRQN